MRYAVGGSERRTIHPLTITPKYIGDRALMQVATLAQAIQQEQGVAEVRRHVVQARIDSTGLKVPGDLKRALTRAFAKEN